MLENRYGISYFFSDGVAGRGRPRGRPKKRSLTNIPSSDTQASTSSTSQADNSASNTGEFRFTVYIICVAWASNCLLICQLGIFVCIAHKAYLT